MNRKPTSPPFDSTLDCEDSDFPQHPEGEQGVLLVGSYESEIVPPWKAIRRVPHGRALRHIGRMRKPKRIPIVSGFQPGRCP
jgi:hypothetical protein